MDPVAEIIPPEPLVGEERHRIRLRLTGAVQGVGFRPYVYRLAVELGLSGSVANSPQGAQVEVEGPAQVLLGFLMRFPKELPPLSSLSGYEVRECPLRMETGFTIRESDLTGPAEAVALPDAALCADCRREIFDSSDRRYLYPFTNCTHCGPRFSILQGFPYDRERTTMASFEMCPECRAEYENPSNRRYHAQPIACPDCGPQLALWNAEGSVTAVKHAALQEAAWAVRAGVLVAVKGLGGFQILCDARDPEAVAKLRMRKHREEKPFAVMFPSLEGLRAECEVSEGEARLLESPAAPIVILDRSRAPAKNSAIARGVAPGNPHLGAFLPTTPLHALLLHELDFPVVATSGNISDEPICIEEGEALKRLKGVADLFLVHDRPIARPVDDSVARVMAGRASILRRARGYAPRPVLLPEVKEGPTILALGGHLKNTVALLDGPRAFVSQHVGDLETAQAFEAFRKAAEDLPRLYNVRPTAAACDAHPDYGSTKFAETLGLPLVRVQHHAAHLAACAAENGVARECLGVSWDGTGWGPDGSVWGGEFFTGRGGAWTRRGRLRPFRLPGGEAAVREPRRSAIGALYEWQGETVFRQTDLWALQSFTGNERRVIRKMLLGGFNCPWTSSVGRLFDAVASLLGLYQKIRFEGQSAMALEFEAGCHEACPYSMPWIEKEGLGTLDWGPTIAEILKDLANQRSTHEIASNFHGALVEGVIKAAGALGQNTVLLGGGCFQNKRLLEDSIRRLRQEGFEVFWPREVPCNDGGLSLGQALIAREALSMKQ